MLEAGAGRDKATHDDVFLQAAEVINLAGNGSFGEDASGLLEAGRGDEGVGRKRCFGDAEEKRPTSSGAAAFAGNTLVLFAEAEFIDLLLEKEIGVADFLDFDPAHHLTNDGFDVLVVDIDALETVDLLNGVDEIGLR